MDPRTRQGEGFYQAMGECTTKSLRKGGCPVPIPVGNRDEGSPRSGYREGSRTGCATGAHDNHASLARNYTRVLGQGIQKPRAVGVVTDEPTAHDLYGVNGRDEPSVIGGLVQVGQRSFLGGYRHVGSGDAQSHKTP